MENRNSLKVWQLASLCLLMWYIWREQNARSFEDRENALLELKKMLQSPYKWITAFNSLPVSNFSEIFGFFFFSSFSLY
jgi:hypothetical protein